MKTKYLELYENVWNHIKGYESKIKNDLLLLILEKNPDFVIVDSGYYFTLTNNKTGVTITYRFPDTDVSWVLYIRVYNTKDTFGISWKFLDTDLETMYEKQLKKFVEI